MSNRRTFLSYAVGMLAAAMPLRGQQKAAVTEKGKAVVCDAGAIKCPLNHDSCQRIDAPIVVGNGNRDYPDYAQLYDVPVFVCDICGILFSPPK